MFIKTEDGFVPLGSIPLAKRVKRPVVVYDAGMFRIDADKMEHVMKQRAPGIPYTREDEIKHLRTLNVQSLEHL